jgi:hypothetical protein
MRDVRVRTTVVIREVLSGSTYRAALRNGKLILAYTQSPDQIPPLAVGDKCSALLSLCDFTEGRLVPADLSKVEMEHPIIEGD